MRDPKERLRDILDGIANIERYAARGRRAFESDELVQNWFVRHLQIIGNAKGLTFCVERERRRVLQFPGKLYRQAVIELAPSAELSLLERRLSQSPAQPGRMLLHPR